MGGSGRVRVGPEHFEVCPSPLGSTYRVGPTELFFFILSKLVQARLIIVSKI